MRSHVARMTLEALSLLALIGAIQASQAEPALISASPPDTPERAIRRVLEDQARAWNSGDIEEYMSGYWKSDETVFTSGGKIIRGWQTVLNNYRKGYPTREAMGELTFSDLEVSLIGPRAAVVLGRWALKRGGDTPHGVFTLILQRFGKDWRITHDHTSLTP